MTALEGRTDARLRNLGVRQTDASCVGNDLKRLTDIYKVVLDIEQFYEIQGSREGLQLPQASLFE